MKKIVKLNVGQEFILYLIIFQKLIKNIYMSSINVFTLEVRSSLTY